MFTAPYTIRRHRIFDGAPIEADRAQPPEERPGGFAWGEGRQMREDQQAQQ